MIRRHTLTLGATLVISMAVFEGKSVASDPPWASVAKSVDVRNLIGKPVTNSRWEQIARIERVLIEPADGRAAFVVLSFLDREEMLALPWNALEIDARGRARLKAGRETLDRAPRIYGSREGSPSEYPNDGAQEPESGLAAFRIASGGEGMLQGRIVGRLSILLENSRRAQALIDIGGETVRVDLGPEDGSAAAIEAGDHVQVIGRYRGKEEFEAVEIRRGGSAFRIAR
jgi:hypothetical protein